LNIWSLLVEVAAVVAVVTLLELAEQVQVVSAQALDLLLPLEQITQSQLAAAVQLMWLGQIQYLALLLLMVEAMALRTKYRALVMVALVVAVHTTAVRLLFIRLASEIPHPQIHPKATTAVTVWSEVAAAAAVLEPQAKMHN
jgi:hypothetical protein